MHSKEFTIEQGTVYKPANVVFETEAIPHGVGAQKAILHN